MSSTNYTLSQTTEARASFWASFIRRAKTSLYGAILQLSEYFRSEYLANIHDDKPRPCAIASLNVKSGPDIW